MLALFLFIQDAPQMAIAPPPAPLQAEVQQSPSNAQPDWNSGSSRELINPNQLTVPHAKQMDPSAPLYTASNMCTIIQGEALPDCAKPAASESANHIVLNDDIFSNSVAGDEATCQTIETVRTDANGRPQRVFASYCGDDIRRNDCREVSLPTGSNPALRPTQRNFGPTNISAVP